MRIIVPVDSRVTDAAALIFFDLFEDVVYTVPVATAGRLRRNGFRGGCIVDEHLLVCTSSQLVRLGIDWPRGSEPRVRIVQVIRRPEWEVGSRANADLHHVYHDPKSDNLLVANSYMDCIDFVAPNGQLVDRRYLWDISQEVMELAYHRNLSAADLCHVNHVFSVLDDIVLTLGNINGSRQGAFLSLATGEILRRGMNSPHDGQYAPEGVWFTEAEGQCAALMEAHSSEELNTASITRLNVLGDDPSSACKGRVWIRGLQLSRECVLVGCSSFDDLKLDNVSSTQSHIVVLDRRTHGILGRVYLPSVEAISKPVIYSIFVYDDEVPIRAFGPSPLKDREL